MFPVFPFDTQHTHDTQCRSTRNLSTLAWKLKAWLTFGLHLKVTPKVGITQSLDQVLDCMVPTQIDHLRMMAMIRVIEMKTKMDMGTATCWELWNQIVLTTIVLKYKVGLIPNQNLRFQSNSKYTYYYLQFQFHINFHSVQINFNFNSIHVCRIISTLLVAAIGFLELRRMDMVEH